jgi:hypothetical protein
MKRTALVIVSLLACSLAAPRPAEAGWLKKIGKEVRARVGGAAWNLARTFSPTTPLAGRYTLTSLAGARSSVLRDLMQKGETPTMAELAGSWQGLNKGVLPSLAGFAGFTKVMQPVGPFFSRYVADGGGHPLGIGNNQVAAQVTPAAWRSGGWQPIVEADGTARKRGFYTVDAPDAQAKLPRAVRLNYARRSENGKDPARLLRDSLVKLDDDHLLGHAVFQLGPLKLPAGYFVLERTRPVP